MDVAPAHYSISCLDLTKILRTHLKGIKRSEIEKIYTDLEKHADYSLTEEPNKIHTVKTTSPDVRKYIHGLFYLPNGKYKYYKLLIDKSTIKGAGYGMFAAENIPKGARAWCRGEHKFPGYANNTYSWSISEFDPVTGKPEDDEDSEIYLVDSFDKSKSNWLRYVNCGLTRKANNLDIKQYFDRIFYVTRTEIKEGEELFVDYGKKYRRENLGIKKY